MPFWNALARVYGRLRSAEMMRDECNRQYPKYTEQNDVGYAYWRKKHAELILEMDSIRGRQLRKLAKTDKEYRQALIDYERQLDASAREVRAETLPAGSDKTAVACKVLATYFATDEMDVKKKMAKDIELIRSFDR